MCTVNECISIINSNQQNIKSTYNVRGLSIFGSVARGDNRSDSDVDILVEMPPKIFLMVGLKNYLESILNSPVDLIRNHSNLSQRFLNQISKDAIRIF